MGGRLRRRRAPLTDPLGIEPPRVRLSMRNGSSMATPTELATRAATAFVRAKFGR